MLHQWRQNETLSENLWDFPCQLVHQILVEQPVHVTPQKTYMAMEIPPFEDVFPIEYGDFPLSCEFFGGVKIWFIIQLKPPFISIYNLQFKESMLFYFSLNNHFLHQRFGSSSNWNHQPFISMDVFSSSRELSMIILNIWILKSFQSALHITQISIRSSMPQSFGLTLGAQKTTTDLPFRQPHPGAQVAWGHHVPRFGRRRVESRIPNDQPPKQQSHNEKNSSKLHPSKRLLCLKGVTFANLKGVTFAKLSSTEYLMIPYEKTYKIASPMN